MTTKWNMRGQALQDGVPHLSVKSAAKGPNHVGRPVPRGQRGTVFAPRNPMYDKAPITQEQGKKDPIRTQLIQRGVK